MASIARADLSVIGTWKDEIQQDDAAVAEYAAGGLDIKKDVCDRCPTRCMDWDGKKLTINNGECVRCMHCINVMPKALRPGKERGATILIGSKAPIVQGALLSSVLVPFVPAAELFDTIKELLSRVWEFWDEYGKNRERVGELIQRVGMANFLDGIGLDPVPEMISAPRDNPYIFFQDQGSESDVASHGYYAAIAAIWRHEPRRRATAIQSNQGDEIDGNATATTETNYRYRAAAL